jgi:integrase
MSKPLSAKTIEAMKPGDKVKVDVGEYSGLRMSCGKSGTKTFIYRYRSPETSKLTQVKIGRYPQVSLAEARVALQALKDLKDLRRSGVCPKTEGIREKEKVSLRIAEQAKDEKTKLFTLTDLIESYLSEFIEDRFIHDGNSVGETKRVTGARKLKGQKETRRTLYGDPVLSLGTMPAALITRKQITDLIMNIVARGANVQAENVLRELCAAYEYSIGLGRFSDDFANPVPLAKSSLRQARVRLTSEKGRRALSDNELSLVLKWLPGSGVSITQKNVLRFALWTGCRTGEVCNAKWKHIDFENRYWHISETKNDTERYVQLSTQAVRFLEGLKLITDNYLFLI